VNRACLDTNIYVAFKQNDREIVSLLRTFDFIGIDATVLAELYAGFRMGLKESANRKDLSLFLESPRVYILSHEEPTAEYYALVVKQLRDKGRPIPTNDVWIAANAIQRGLPLLTLDDHFKEIDGLLLVGIERGETTA
jgi:tRNA(fMet)-specific endonuclease VapC